jgi:hypothetical protein
LAAAHRLRADALNGLKRWAEALAAYDRAAALAPADVAAWNDRGTVLLALDRVAEGLASFETAARLQPGFADAHNNRAVALRLLGRLEEAVAAADHVLAQRPSSMEAWINRGSALLDMGLPEQARANFRTAWELNPNAQAARFNEAIAALLLGDCADGWQAWEARWGTAAFAPSRRDFPQPLWLGRDDIAGRTVLLHAEQGFGDTLQFCRYVPLVAARGARVVLELPAPLAKLLRSLQGGPYVVPRGDPLPDFDLHCPLMSLPLAFGTHLASIPADVPYLAPPEDAVQRWADKLGPRRTPRIGLAWSGSRGYGNDRRRSIPLEHLRPLAGLEAALYSLQRDLRPPDVPAFAAMRRVVHFGRTLSDFAETAAVISQLDLIIAVDTAVAHLAGALDKPVWLLLPFAPDWRWLLGRSDSPWYPTARLFRQQRPGDWPGVLAEVMAALQAWLAEAG